MMTQTHADRCGPTAYAAATFICIKHGPRRTNLCERCLAVYARGGLPMQLSAASLQPVSQTGFNQSIDFLADKFQLIQKLKPFLTLLLSALWAVLCAIGQITVSCLVCFAMMWFVQPNMTPKQKQLKEEREDAEYEEWYAAREVEYERKRAEDEAWRQGRLHEWDEDDKQKNARLDETKQEEQRTRDKADEKRNEEKNKG